MIKTQTETGKVNNRVLVTQCNRIKLCRKEGTWSVWKSGERIQGRRGEVGSGFLPQAVLLGSACDDPPDVHFWLVQSFVCSRLTKKKLFLLPGSLKTHNCDTLSHGRHFPKTLSFHKQESSRLAGGCDSPSSDKETGAGGCWGAHDWPLGQSRNPTSSHIPSSPSSSACGGEGQSRSVNWFHLRCTGESVLQETPERTHLLIVSANIYRMPVLFTELWAPLKPEMFFHQGTKCPLIYWRCKPPLSDVDTFKLFVF